MKSVSQKEQQILDQRINQKLDSYIEKLDYRPEAILDDSIKASKLKARLKKRGSTQIADELDIVTSKKSTNRVIIEKMNDYIPQSDSDDVSDEELASKTKLNVAKVAVEAVQGLSDMVSSRFLYEGAERARTVGRISNINGPEAIGTGFMISPNLLMTNYHVLDSEDAAADCYVEFDYYYSKDNTRVKSEIYNFRPNDFFHKSTKYDYAIVRVEAISDQQVELNTHGWNNLESGSSKAETSDRLNIVHHPLGSHQQISIRKNFVVDVEKDDMYVEYLSDTDYGSSGSPVFNDEWDIVALHRGHVTIKDDAKKQKFLQELEKVSRDLANEMRVGNITFNIGIKIEIILEDLKNARSSMSKEDQRQVDLIFEAKNNSDGVAVEPSPANETSNNIPSGTNRNDQQNSPVAQHININGGNVTLNLAHSFLGNTKDKNASEINNDTTLKIDLELYKKSFTVQASIFKALDYVQKAREQKYLPSQAELDRIKTAYYGDIIDNAAGLSKAEMYDALSAKMEDTFQIVNKFPDPLDLEEDIQVEASNPSSYNKARAHLYTRIDLQPDGSLKGIYSGANISPEQLMLVDLIKSLKETEYVLPKRYKNSDYLNCEHIVPKTYFDRMESGFSDLHHLITADGAVNKFRNKNTFADLSQSGDDGRHRLPVYVPSGGWKRGDHFEPARGKGLVARATLYFFVAHRNFISTDVYSSEQIETLIAWSKAEAPTDYEQHRNQTIFEVQGNRNPFIDFPDWVDMVDFSRGVN